MKSATLSSVTSLLSALFLVVALTLTGCTADSLTGPVLSPETTVQGNGDQPHNNKTGDQPHNN